MDVKASEVYGVLSKIDVSSHIEKKNGLNYLSWAWAWAITKENYPEATYKVYERETEYGLVNYFTDGKTCWVKTGVTINGLEYIEELPVMNYSNKSIPLENVTSFDVNKTIQRSLTKCLARHGLGLTIYAGEDLPDTPVTLKEAKEYKFEFGKYQGKTIEEVNEERSSYLDWFLENGTDDRVKEMIKLVTDKKPITDDELKEKANLITTLSDLVNKTDTDWDLLLKHYGVKNNTDMSIEQLKDAVKNCELKLKASK